jgi:two-component system, chemotaxis family, protein-glutamate methylesterase/glutaminase
MPSSAIEYVSADYILPVSEMAPVLAQVVSEPVEEMGVTPMPHDMYDGPDAGASDRRRGSPSVYTCPECHGTLWEVHQADLPHFRCRVGHAYSSDSLLAGQGDALEAALWTALRSLEEKEALTRRLEVRARHTGHLHAADRFSAQVRETSERAEIVRRALMVDAGTADESASPR